MFHQHINVNVDGCEKDSELARRMNAEVPQRIVNISEKTGATVIQISTDAVYKDTNDNLHKEESEVSPVNIYGQTKLNGEKPVLKYKKGIVLRTNIYGFNIQDKCSFGEWILSAMQKNEMLRMVEDVRFSPILVNDVADVIDKIIEKEIFGLFNVCATGSISKYDFGVYFSNVFGFVNARIEKIKSDDLKLIAPRSKNMGMNNERIGNELGMSIRTPYESIEYFKTLYDANYHKELKSFGGIY